MSLITSIENDGYQLLMTEKKDRNKNTEGGDSVSIYLNEEKNDFKIVMNKNLKSNKSSFEWDVLDVKKYLDKSHPVSIVVNKLQKIKEVDEGLRNMTIKPKKMKM